MTKDIITSLRNILILWILTALIYPGVILGVGQIAFPYQANGSLITNAKKEIIGSSLIGQTFTGEEYFWSRPSVVNYSEGKVGANTGVSGGSNLAPDNPELLERIAQEAQRLESEGVKPTADLLYTSGSGLDPHITPEAAQAQIQRVATTRNLSTEQLKTLIAKNTDHRFLRIFGEPGVNVVKINLALDQL